VISNQAKNHLRKLISKRTEKLADTVQSVTGVEKESLNKMKIAKQLKTTMNNDGKRVIRSFESPNLTRMHQNSAKSKSSYHQVTKIKLKKGD